jgi:hypothetical protein
MRAYVGQTRSRKLIARLAALGIGECFTRSDSVWPPRRFPWFLDNGAFGDWRSGRTFDDAAFESCLELAAGHSIAPDFVVCPDIVAGGAESLAFSLRWLDKCSSRFPDLRWYLVVQDGMTAEMVRPHLHRFAGLFVGGTLAWKIREGEAWARFAEANEMPCHVGRVGTARRVAWARRSNVSSIDSALPLWSEENLRSFLAALDLDGTSAQTEMPW